MSQIMVVTEAVQSAGQRIQTLSQETETANTSMFR
jgi:hypothetical protein